jgi:hypothetical protein
LKCCLQGNALIHLCPALFRRCDRIVGIADISLEVDHKSGGESARESDGRAKVSFAGHSERFANRGIIVFIPTESRGADESNCLHRMRSVVRDWLWSI